jgi:hypothetical protein
MLVLLVPGQVLPGVPGAGRGRPDTEFYPGLSPG